MIDQIRIHTAETSGGRKFEQVRIWICGIPFHADNSEYVEKIVRRVAADLDMAVIDARPALPNPLSALT